MPLLEGSPGAKAAMEAGTAAPGDVASMEDLACCLGRFLHVCPGLDKVGGCRARGSLGSRAMCSDVPRNAFHPIGHFTPPPRVLGVHWRAAG